MVGMYLADASLFIACARTLATFNITKAIENGEVVEPKPEYTSGTIRCVWSARDCQSRSLNVFLAQSSKAVQVPLRAALRESRSTYSVRRRVVCYYNQG